ncbi:mannose-6-phosphate isomerase, class I [Jeotgalibacillus haloalkalitolerans]|uniref:Mannose-6-phosphate isomerase n=1 Tax=Jeotgalibacillus haloalkalitolerans TaxID=3104292 RepID=A0ABU5KJJ9_9BACL|nr:mannose-6-phosphate isomerase, class I [Jeotgalibacillus sp. HH7-29]MDZ5711428.1 mannose-6-phosphate isomerase, class I [Jeotgalibacillus sp. HH7-29]
MTIYKLKPHFQNKIWGGRKLETVFQYDIPAGPVGECWGISAHKNGESIIENGPFKGMTLSELWEQNKLEVFGEYPHESFPLLVKILDADSDLSVQVHPDNHEAKELEGEPFGKTECWYVLDAKPGAELIIGHNAKSKEELTTEIQKGNWKSLLRKRKVKKGDFIFIESGTLHAIGSGILLLEIQQSSDTTYRVYDFDRRDQNGHLRELHHEKAIRVTNTPDQFLEKKPESRRTDEAIISQMISTKEFSVWLYQVDGKVNLKTPDRFKLLSVTEGQGKVLSADGGNITELKKGDHYLVPRHSEEVVILGKVEFVVSGVE